jgi:hypothetical protein
MSRVLHKAFIHEAHLAIAPYCLCITSCCCALPAVSKHAHSSATSAC